MGWLRISKYTRTATVVFALLAPSVLKADDQAYFVSTGGQFGTIDLDTGVAKTLGTSALFQLAGLGQVGGALYTAQYGAGGTLYTVNPSSGALNAVGNSSIIFFALGSTTTGLYAAGWPAGTNTQANPTLYFYSIDPRTATATRVGQFGLSPGFYAWCFSTGSPTLYFADFENLYSIDTNSGGATLIGGTSGTIIGGLAYENSKLYAAQNSPNVVYTLDPTSGAATAVANFTGTTIAGLAPITAPTVPQILSQFAFGGGWYSALYFTNSSAAAVSFTVNFIADNGTPLTLPSIGSSSTTVNLAPQATTILEAPNAGALTQGYVTAALPAGVNGYAVFRQSVQGIADQEAVVPLASASSTGSTLIYDDTNYTTSVAIANPSVVPVTISITLWDGSGNVVGTSSMPLAAGTKTEAELRNLPGLSAMAGKRGSAKFSVSSGFVSVLGLRFNGARSLPFPRHNSESANARTDVYVLLSRSQSHFDR
jgi:hypothetical protein